jgi:Uma2 family endonuclease
MHLTDHVLGLLDAEKPYIEIIDGRGREKNVSPEWPHSRAQSTLSRIFMDYADAHRGDAGLELRFIIDDDNALIPDVSYYTEAQMLDMGETEKRYPRRPPYAAVEIRSSDDRPGDRERKIDRYLSLGSRIVLDVDPKRETLTVIDATGARVFTKDETLEHVALPGLRVELAPFFARVNR